MMVNDLPISQYHLHWSSDYDSSLVFLDSLSWLTLEANFDINYLKDLKMLNWCNDEVPLEVGHFQDPNNLSPYAHPKSMLKSFQLLKYNTTN